MNHPPVAGRSQHARFAPLEEFQTETLSNTSIAVLLVDNNGHYLLHLTSVINLGDKAVAGLMEV
jgi:hypothetical protein